MSVFQHTLKITNTIVLSTIVLAVIVLFPNISNAAVSVVVNGGSGSNAERQIVTLNNQILGQIQMLVAKEYNLDPRASASAKAAVAYYNEMRAFLASGDSGNPFFVDNLELYKAGIRTKTTENVIKELENSKICNAFKNDVLAQVKQLYMLKNARSVAERNACQLEVASQNAKAFLEGDFDQGGFEALYAIGLNPEENTPLGKIFDIEEKYTQEADEAEENAMEEYRAGDGFKSQYEAGKNVLVCTEGAGVSQGAGGGGDLMGIRNRCRIARPSEAVRIMAAGMQRVADIVKTSADELQEDVISNTINQAIQQTVVTGITGTAYNVTGPVPPPGTTPPGPTPPPGGGGLGDPLPNIPNDFKSTTTKSFLALVAQNLNRATSTNPVKAALTRTLTKLQYQIEIVKTIDDVETAHEFAIEKYQPYSCYNLAFPNNFGNERTLTLTEAPQTIIAIKQLYLALMMFEDSLKEGTSTAEAIALFNQIIQTNFSVPNEVDLGDIAFKYNDFRNNQIASFNTSFAQQVNACELIINPPQNPPPGGGDGDSGP